MIRRSSSILIAALLAMALTLVPIAPRVSHASPGDVVIGSATFPLAGVNIWRAADTLVLYTHTSSQTTSPANRWGVEVAVVNGTVTERRSYEPGMPIPPNGVVLSGHDDAAQWLLTHTSVGTRISIPGLAAPPPDDPEPDPIPLEECSSGYVRLTFDDGPHPIYTPIIIDALAERGMTATFFVLGQRVGWWPSLVTQMVNEGQRVANHTWDHPNLTQLPPEEVEDQLVRTSDIIELHSGVRPTEWRPPFGAFDDTTLGIAETLDLSLLMWSPEVDTRDWRSGRTAAEVTGSVLNNVSDGAIILAHDIHAVTAEATPEILDGLTARGFCLR